MSVCKSQNGAEDLKKVVGDPVFAPPVSHDHNWTEVPDISAPLQHVLHEFELGKAGVLVEELHPGDVLKAAALVDGPSLRVALQHVEAADSNPVAVGPGHSAVMVTLALAACGSDTQHEAPATQQSVNDVLQQQTEEAAGSEASTGSFAGDASSAYAEVDYDLTAMNAEMVYATVNDIITNSSNYLGKVIKMTGPYYHTYSEETATDYFYVIIQDATACCAQGLEYVWGDGSHVYPGEYPEDGREAVVTGRFEVYTEGDVRYAHLVDASFEAA